MEQKDSKSLLLPPSSSPDPATLASSSTAFLMPNEVSSDTQHRRQNGRGRSSSLVSVREIEENYDGTLDQGAMSNWNAEWVNYKGAWIIHVILLLVGKLLLDSLPLVSQDISWTLVNTCYMLATFIIFHYTTGIPLESDTTNSGAYDRLTLWEQIDYGAQYTPSKKWLTLLPIGVFLLTTHYVRGEHSGLLFALNFSALVVFGLIPKLPIFHRVRLRFDGLGPRQGDGRESEAASRNETGPPTPVEMGDTTSR